MPLTQVTKDGLLSTAIADKLGYTPANDATVTSALSGKQATLVSGTNIKTVNSTSLVGSGDVAVQPTLVSGTNIKTVNSATILGSGDIAVQPTLVSGTNIKTVAGQSLLGSGNIAVGSVVQVISTNTTAVAGNMYVATAVVTLTLPAAPNVGDVVGFNNQTSNLTSVINNNGLKINGLTETMTVDAAYASMEFIYTGATNGWVLS